MDDYWREIGFELIWTGDGSPSLKPLGGFECMHHPGGAWSETQEIYGSVVREGLHFGARQFLSVGLGLGYNELVIASEIAKLWERQASSEMPFLEFLRDFQLWSFESEDVLVREFFKFVREPQVDSVYFKILSLFDNPEATLKVLLELQNRGRFKTPGRLDEHSSQVLSGSQIEVYLFDAYSSRTSPELWSEEFLRSFLRSSASASKALFSTYACTGHLKRALVAEGFELTVRPGFFSKRNSTLGRRLR